MATVTFKGTPVNTSGNLPKIGSKAPAFNLVNTDLEQVSSTSLKDTRLVLNIFPSIDTGVCAQSVREFNKRASSLKNTKVLCISRDLPFAHARFCGAEGIENVLSLSDFATQEFGKSYGIEISNSFLKGLLARAVVVVNEKGEVVYTELVPEIATEPNYDAALKSLA